MSKEEGERLLRAASALFLIGDHFIQKLLPQDNVAAAAQVIYLNDIRKWEDEYKSYRKLLTPTI